MKIQLAIVDIKHPTNSVVIYPDELSAVLWGRFISSTVVVAIDVKGGRRELVDVRTLMTAVTLNNVDNYKEAVLKGLSTVTDKWENEDELSSRDIQMEAS